MKRLSIRQFVLIGTAILFLGLVASWAVGSLVEQPTDAPSTIETCTLYYLDEAARAEGRAFSLWCPTTGWVELADRPLP